MSDSGVVTPEGVLLDYRNAGLATRTFGRLIDLSLQVLLGYFGLLLALSLLISGSATPWIIVAVIYFFLILFAYPVAFEVYGGGRTPGHRATGTRVIRTDGGPVRFRHAAIRSILFLVDGLLTSGFAGAVSVLSTARGQRLGDLAAGTMVVRIDSPVSSQPLPLAVSKSLLERAARFDTRRLDADDITSARLLLERGADFLPGAQHELASRLADRLDGQLGGVRQHDDPAAAFVAVVVQAASASFTVRGPPNDAVAPPSEAPPPPPGEAAAADFDTDPPETSFVAPD